MTIVEYFSKKYPDSIDNGQISLTRLANILQMYLHFKKTNDFDSIKILGLTDLMEDVKYVGNDKEYLLYQREQKLKRILNE